MPIATVQVIRSDQKVRIVEVGSGSGGTSVVVMAALADLGDRIEFVYTDISPQLVTYGRKTYGPTYPFATFRLLDVEKDTEDQVSFCLFWAFSSFGSQYCGGIPMQ